MLFRSYVDQSGQKRYVTEVVADEVYFADSKRESGEYDESGDKLPYQSEDKEWKKAESSDDDFFPGSDEDSTSLPFDMN